MWWRSNTARVVWPVTFTATRCDTPAFVPTAPPPEGDGPRARRVASRVDGAWKRSRETSQLAKSRVRPEPEVSLESVRTLLVGLPGTYPTRWRVPLTDRQTASSACGRARSRRRQAARLAERDGELRRLLAAALRILDDRRIP